MKKILFLLPLLALTLAGCVKISDNTNNINNDMNNTDLLSSKCAVTPEKIDDKTYSTHPCILPDDQLKNKKVTIETTEGNIVIDLFEDESPYTVSNFMFLAKEGFYDNVIFHRVIPGFMIQGGDPDGIGTGGPGYAFADEFNDKKIKPGSLAMANSGPNTNGSQFFIVTDPIGQQNVSHLDGVHTNFGQVIEGMDVVNKISSVDVDGQDKPLTDIKIKSIKIEELN